MGRYIGFVLWMFAPIVTLMGYGVRVRSRWMVILGGAALLIAALLTVALWMNAPPATGPTGALV